MSDHAAAESRVEKHVDVPTEPSRAVNRTGVAIRLCVAVSVLALAAVGYKQYGGQLTLQNLALYETSFRQFQHEHPWLIYAIAFGAYVSVAGLAIPGAAAMTLLMGWLFGMARGVVLVSFASTAGACLAFLLSRYLLRETIQHRFGDRLARFNDALRREGAYYLLTLRLIPAVPFFVINVVMGLTPLRLSTFWWVSQIGMLPGTAAFVYAGSAVPNLQQLADNGLGGTVGSELFFAFAILGMLPILLKKTLGRVNSV